MKKAVRWVRIWWASITAGFHYMGFYRRLLYKIFDAVDKPEGSGQ